MIKKIGFGRIGTSIYRHAPIRYNVLANGANIVKLIANGTRNGAIHYKPIANEASFARILSYSPKHLTKPNKTHINSKTSFINNQKDLITSYIQI